MAKYFTAWRINLLVSGLLGTLVMLAPGFIWAGYWLFFFPGLILFVAPSWFLYSAALTVLAFPLRRFGGWRWLLALAVLALPAFYLPYSGNQGTWRQAGDLMADDIDVSSPVELHGTVALVHSVFPSHTGRHREACLGWCPRLLYQSGVERVMVVVHAKTGEGDRIDSPANAELSVTAYFIEQREDCPPETTAPYPDRARLAAGDCLMSEAATLAEADFVYVTEEVTPTRHHALDARFDLAAVTVTATRKRVIRKTAQGAETLYQKTEIEAWPLVYPLTLSGIMHGGGSGEMSLGFIRERIHLNSFRGFGWREEPRIFGFAELNKGPAPAGE